jgi:hypothetical protein
MIKQIPERKGRLHYSLSLSLNLPSKLTLLAPYN